MGQAVSEAVRSCGIAPQPQLVAQQLEELCQADARRVTGPTPLELGIDPVLVRVAFALSILITGLGLVAWVVPAVLMPRQARVSGP